jgi:ABC-type multidrug transport system ATPase subunit
MFAISSLPSTSGLDSYTSNEVMTVVKNLVKDGTTICATIVSMSVKHTPLCTIQVAVI